MSTLKVDSLSNLLGTKTVPMGTVVDGAAKAWVNFNGTGTVAIRASFNVSSITDNAPGDYTINFATAMPDANFVMLGSAWWTTSGGPQSCVAIAPIATPLTAAGGRIQTFRSDTAALVDFLAVLIAVFR